MVLLKNQKNSIASDIKNLESGITDSSINKKLDRAALHVQKSASNNLWNNDQNTLDSKKGKKVFNQEAKSVNILLNLQQKTTSLDTNLQDSSDDDANDQDLSSITTSTLPTSVVTSINVIINKLVSIDGNLAQTQIATANAHLAYLQSHNADPAKIQQVQQNISNANSFIQKAQSDSASGNFHRAIFEYREAWAAAASASNLTGANLSGANLQGINLSGVNLQGVNLQNANLSGANFIGANLQGANLNGANTTGTIGLH